MDRFFPSHFKRSCPFVFSLRESARVKYSWPFDGPVPGTLAEPKKRETACTLRSGHIEEWGDPRVQIDMTCRQIVSQWLRFPSYREISSLDENMLRELQMGMGCLDGFRAAMSRADLLFSGWTVVAAHAINLYSTVASMLVCWTATMISLCHCGNSFEKKNSCIMSRQLYR